jgi:acetoacetate decarboxylase
MPDAGQLTEDLVAHTGPTAAPLYAAPPWKLPDARILKVMYETDKEPVLAWLPPKLTRSSPPYAIIEVAHFPETPVGPFTLATQLIGCRASFFMRAFAVQAVVDNPVAMAALREVWGFPCRPGEVRLEEPRGGVTATVDIDGQTACETGLTDIEVIETDTARFDPTLTLRLAPSVQEDVRHDLIQIMQLDPEQTIKEAQRGRGFVRLPEEASEWALLPNRNIISATWCKVDTELPLARFVLPY